MSGNLDKLVRLKTFLIFYSLIFTCCLIVSTGVWRGTRNHKRSFVSPGGVRVWTIWNEEALLIINTTNCKIPNFQPWSLLSTNAVGRSCSDFFLGEPNCGQKGNSWTYVNGSVLHLNVTAIGESGYSWNTIQCCYRVIIRVEQPLNSSDMRADNRITHSNTCYPINQPTQFIDADFLRVTCNSTSARNNGEEVKRELVAIAKADEAALGKMRKWEETVKKDRTNQNFSSPHILILGVDSMSRLASQRNLNKTLELMQSVGATEMKGYMKVGVHTLSNVFGFLAGFTKYEVKKFCFRDDGLKIPMDLCPFLFKDFNEIGYLTTTLEDCTSSNIFNHMKKGFVQKPVDFYLRPFMIDVFESIDDNTLLRCLGSRQIEDVILNYLEDILKLAAPSKTPLFSLVWLTSMSHDCGTSAKYVDSLLAKYISKFITSFGNTILIFMSDHGESFGQFRETFQGWYEDNLPMFWIYLPPPIRNAFPEWVDALQINSNRVTSHFDLYKTLVHLLHTFDKDNRLGKRYEMSKTQRGQSLFEPVLENRTCQSARIDDTFCVCSKPTTMEFDNLIRKAAMIAVEHISELLPEACEKPTLKKIQSAKFWLHPSGFKIYIVTFLTNPGDFLFEVSLKANEGTEGKIDVLSDVRRVNKMMRSASCVEDSVLEKLCYCK